MIPLWVIRYALPGLGAVLALYGCYSWAHGRGVAEERSKWQRASIAAERAAQAKSAAMQAQVDAAGAALSEKQQQIADAMRVQKVNTRAFYVQNPSNNVACLTDDRLRAIAESDSTATFASAAK